MRKKVLPCLLLLPLLSGCEPSRKVLDISKMYVGTYTQIESKTGGSFDTYLNISFIDASSADKAHEPDLKINLNSGDRLKLNDDTPTRQVRYYDVAEGFSSARPTWSSLSGFLLAGGLVEVFESASKYDSSVMDPAISGRIYLTSCGYAYSLSTFSVSGEKLEVNKSAIWTWSK